MISGEFWSGTGSCPSAHDDSVVVRGVRGRGHIEEGDESEAKREIPVRIKFPACEGGVLHLSLASWVDWRPLI